MHLGVEVLASTALTGRAHMFAQMTKMRLVKKSAE